MYARLLLAFLALSSVAAAMAPRAASWHVNNMVTLAALDGEVLRVAFLEKETPEELYTLPAKDISTLAAGIWRNEPVLLAARGRTLLRLNHSGRRWETLGKAPAPIREIAPSPDGSAGAMLLTGSPGGTIPPDGAVYWASWPRRFRCTRVKAVKDTYRPWQLCWTRAGEEQRFAAATYKATTFMDFEHNCLFLFTWQGNKAEACWLGSRLSRPYIDVTHADLRSDGYWRMVALETAQEGGYLLSVYRPIGFGYESEWQLTEVMSDLSEVAAYGNIVLCREAESTGTEACAWQLLPEQEGYRLQPLPASPPALKAVARVDDGHLAWWDGAWRCISLAE